MNRGTSRATGATLWICSACGKRAMTRWGIDEHGCSTALDPGWDESCALNAVLCHNPPVLHPYWTPVEAES